MSAYEHFADPPSHVSRHCELCGSVAHSYCHADEASLCNECDVKVHSANFLVTRHIRYLLCESCFCLTRWSKCGIQMHNFPRHCEACQRSDPKTAAEVCLSDSENSTMSFNSGSTGFRRSLNSSVSSNHHTTQSGPQHGSESESLRTGLVNRKLIDLNETPESPSSVLSSDRSQMRPRTSSVAPCLHKKVLPSVSLQGCSSEESSSFPPTNKRKTNPGCCIAKSKRARVQNGLEGISPSKFKFFKPNPEAAGQDVKPLGNLAAARLQRVLSSWHSHLCLKEDETKRLAFKLFCRVLQNLEPRHFVPYSLRIILSACYWVSSKMVENQTNVPKASQISRATGVPTQLITSAEIQILSLLDWKVLQDWRKED